MTRAADATDRPAQRPPANAWTAVAGQELRTLWLSGRGLTMMLAHTTLLSLSTYLVASNQELNFLEQREAVNITVAIAVVVGGFLVLLVAADAISGERERGTLEVLLLTPAPRTGLLVGKALAAMSLWVAAFGLSLPYIWWLGRDVGTFRPAALGGLLVGSLMAFILVGLGLLVSTLSRSNGLSLALSAFALLALLVPRQMPAEATRGWAGELLLRVDPLAAGLLYLDRVILNGHSLGQNAHLLVAPAVLAVLFPAVALAVSGRLRLLPGSGS